MARARLMCLFLHPAAISVYVILAFEFVYRFIRNKPLRATAEGFKRRPEQLDANIKLMLFGLGFSSLCVFIRCVVLTDLWVGQQLMLSTFRSVYRTIELSNGWTGRIIHTQVYFSAFLTLF